MRIVREQVVHQPATIRSRCCIEADQDSLDCRSYLGRGDACRQPLASVRTFHIWFWVAGHFSEYSQRVICRGFGIWHLSEEPHLRRCSVRIFLLLEGGYRPQVWLHFQRALDWACIPLLLC